MGGNGSGKRKRKLTQVENDFREHLIAGGLSPTSAPVQVDVVRRFLKHVGESRIDRISEEATRSFFAGAKSKQTIRDYANAVS